MTFSSLSLSYTQDSAKSLFCQEVSVRDAPFLGWQHVVARESKAFYFSNHE